MSDSQPEIIKLVTYWLTEIIKCYEEDLQDVDKEDIEYVRILAKIEALSELIFDINEPIVFVEVTTEMQQAMLLIEAKNIINDNPDKS